MDFAENLKLYSKVKTLSIAFPSSIFANAPTLQIEAYLVGQLARAAVIFNVSEIVIYDEADKSVDKERTDRLVKLFEYAECPQYLRKRIFGIEPDLKFAGLIHPLEAQHHLRTSQLECPYREGVAINNVKVDKKDSSVDMTEVNVGLQQSVLVPGTIELSTRVTLKVDPHDLKKMQSMLGPAMEKKPEAMIVPPVEPVERLNLHWGYYIRKAESLSHALKSNIFDPSKKKFYDLIIGTSERGTCVDDIVLTRGTSIKKGDQAQPSKRHKGGFKHVLVVFGGVRGLEHSVSCDSELKDCNDVRGLFDHYINTCPNQGSTTIRTEEAILITLSALRPKLNL